MSKHSIVITSIFQPTEAVVAFSKQKKYSLIVVGDKKTPTDWQCEGVTYLSVEKQNELDFELSKSLPYNHYCRKMIGYLHAIRSGTQIIVDTDDDNIPKEGWRFPSFEGEFDTVGEGKGFVNVYKLYSDLNIWPRGLPLNKVLDPSSIINESEIKKEQIKVGIWQGLADEDPDVDAVYRLTNNTLCYFNERQPCVLGKNTLSPYNSQNTAYRKELFPLLYLPTYVTFRFTDILRGLVAQPIMWAHGYHLGFVDATVVQKRNPHNYMKDFESELPMYLHTDKVIELVNGIVNTTASIEENLFNAYAALNKHGIVPDEEMVTLNAWLKDLERLKNTF